MSVMGKLGTAVRSRKTAEPAPDLPLGQILQDDCVAAMAKLPDACVDMVFADPPYAPGSGNAAVQSVCGAGWLGSGGWMSVETARGEAVQPDELILDSARDVGSARLTLLRRP